jgi:hypothetical protein
MEKKSKRQKQRMRVGQERGHFSLAFLIFLLFTWNFFLFIASLKASVIIN